MARACEVRTTRKRLHSINVGTRTGILSNGNKFKKWSLFCNDTVIESVTAGFLEITFLRDRHIQAHLRTEALTYHSSVPKTSWGPHQADRHNPGNIPYPAVFAFVVDILLWTGVPRPWACPEGTLQTMLQFFRAGSRGSAATTEMC